MNTKTKSMNTKAKNLKVETSKEKYMMNKTNF